MLFGKKRKRDLRIFSVPNDVETAGTKIPLRLVIGLLTPFVIVAIFLLIFSKKIDLTTTVLKPGLPPAPPVSVANSTPPQPPVVALKKPDETPVLQATRLPTGGIVESEIPLPSIKKPEVLKKPEPVKQAEVVKKPEPVKQAEVVKKPEPVKQAEVVKKPEPVKQAEVVKKPEPVKQAEAIKKPETVKTPETVKQPEAVKEIAAVKEPEPVTEPIKQSLASGTGRFAIQVGSFQKKEEADSLASKLKDRGYETYVVMANIVDKGDWYRVRIGKYENRPKALEAAEKLSQAEQLSAIIVTRHSPE